MPNSPQEQSDETENVSFADILQEFEQSHKVTRPASGKPARGRGRRQPSGSPTHRGTVVGVSDDFVLVDYGAKSEGMILSADLRDRDGTLKVKRGDTFDVTVTGFNSTGMAKLSRVAGPRPQDWDSLTRAFEQKEVIAARVTA